MCFEAPAPEAEPFNGGGVEHNEGIVGYDASDKPPAEHGAGLSRGEEEPSTDRGEVGDAPSLEAEGPLDRTNRLVLGQSRPG